MNQCVQPGPFSRRRKRWQDKRVRQLKRLANMRAAKLRKRLAHPAELEPRLEAWFPLELGVRDRATGEEAWVVLKSLRDALRRLAVLVRYYEPGLDGYGRRRVWVKAGLEAGAPTPGLTRSG